MPIRQYVLPGHAKLVSNAALQGRPAAGARPARQGQPAGAADAGRRTVQIQPAGRDMSHKLITYFDTAIPSCPGRSGARSAGEGTASVPVACGGPTGVWSACLLPVYRYMRRHLLRSTAVYAYLFYTKLLILLELLSFDLLFSSKLPSVLQRGRRPAVAPARHRQGGGRPRDAKLAAFYYATNIRFRTMGLSHNLITYLEALTPSCPAGRGSGRSGGSQAPAGVFRVFALHIYVPIARNWLRSMAVYAHLFLPKLLFSLSL